MVKEVINLSGLSDLLSRLWHHLSKRRRRQLLLLPWLILISVFAELVSLGAIVPFLGVLAAPEMVFNHPFVAEMSRFLGFTSADQLVVPFAVFFGLAAVVAAFIRLCLLWVNLRFSNALASDFSLAVYRRTLYQPYRQHLARNSSEILSGIYKVSVVQSVVQVLLTMVSSMILIVSIALALLAFNPEVALAAMVGLGLCYGIIARLSGWRLKRNGVRVAYESTQMIKALQEGLGGIRDVLLDGTQEFFCGVYRKSLLKAMMAHVSTQFVGMSPRYIMEAMGLVLIAALAIFLSRQDGGLVEAMPLLGVLAFAAQRMLPAIQQFYSGWAEVVGNKASMLDALQLLDQPLPLDVDQVDCEIPSFEHAICFDKARFRYHDDGPWVLDGLDLLVHKGERVGLIGDTGSGKSTLIDLLMGHLEPEEGDVLVDGISVKGKYRRGWQKTIAHVPQSIYLADATLAENIAFGVPSQDIDMNRVRQASHQAQIAEFIEGKPEGYELLVGERGARLSGGQRQRIGIARALYKQARVIIFDEATSALDNETEKAVMQSIDSLSKDITLLIIAHRLTTLKNCSRIIELGGGTIRRIGSYQDVMQSSLISS